MSEILIQHNRLRLSPDQERLPIIEGFARSAERMVGTSSGPYNPNEIFSASPDCSAWVTQLLTQNNIPVPEGIRHSNEYFDKFGVSIHLGLHKRGDLIFFSYDGGVKPTHMGIILGPETYIHAPGKKDSVVSIEKIQFATIENPSTYQQYARNPIGVKRPTIEQGRWQLPLTEDIFHRGV